VSRSSNRRCPSRRRPLSAAVPGEIPAALSPGAAAARTVHGRRSDLGGDHQNTLCVVSGFAATLTESIPLSAWDGTFFSLFLPKLFLKHPLIIKSLFLLSLSVYEICRFQSSLSLRCASLLFDILSDAIWDLGIHLKN